MMWRWWAAALLALASVSGPAVAQAAEGEGVLVVLPATGTLEDPLSVATVGTCERGTTFMVTVSGRGIEPGADDIIVGATDLTWLESNGYPSHEVALSITLDRFFQRVNIDEPLGEYTMTFHCRNRLDVESLQAFSASIAVTPEATFEALGSAALELPTAIEEAGIDAVAVPGSDEVAIIDAPAEPNGSAGSDSSGGIPADVAGPQSTGAGSTPTDLSASPTSWAADDSLRTWLLVIGAVLLVGAMAGWITMRRRESQAQGSDT